MARPEYLPDNFTLCLVGVVILASMLPAHGRAMPALNWLTDLAIALLFFLHGAKLSRASVIAGATHWRLHLFILMSTFVMFPVFGMVLKPVLAPLVTPALYAGVLFLCTLPSTVQTSVAFASIAKGNVPAAVCSASASSLLGIFITPVLAGLLIAYQASHADSGGSVWHTVGNITLQLLVPFVAGQLLRPVIGRWIDIHRAVLKIVDQGSILLIVYGAFSEASNEGLWHHTSLMALGGIVIVDVFLLCLALGTTAFVSRRLGFSRPDQITIIFCGSKKSLAAGVPMAKVLFASSALGAVVLPVMLFHQIQLMVCAALAQRWGRRDTGGEEDGRPGTGKMSAFSQDD